MPQQPEAWNNPHNRQMLSQFNSAVKKQQVYGSYAAVARTPRFIASARILQHVMPQMQPALFDDHMRGIGLFERPLVPYTLQQNDELLLTLCQVDPATGEAILYSDMTVAKYSDTAERYVSTRKQFNLHQVNLLGRQAAQLAEAQLVPLPPVAMQ